MRAHRTKAYLFHMRVARINPRLVMKTNSRKLVERQYRHVRLADHNVDGFGVLIVIEPLTLHVDVHFLGEIG